MTSRVQTNLQRWLRRFSKKQGETGMALKKKSDCLKRFDASADVGCSGVGSKNYKCRLSLMNYVMLLRFTQQNDCSEEVITFAGLFAQLYANKNFMPGRQK